MVMILVFTQEVNSAELLRVYLDYDLLEEASNLVLELIDAVCGKGKEYYGLKVGKYTYILILFINYLQYFCMQGLEATV